MRIYKYSVCLNSEDLRSHYGNDEDGNTLIPWEGSLTNRIYEMVSNGTIKDDNGNTKEVFKRKEGSTISAAIVSMTEEDFNNAPDEIIKFFDSLESAKSAYPTLDWDNLGKLAGITLPYTPTLEQILNEGFNCSTIDSSLNFSIGLDSETRNLISEGYNYTQKMKELGEMTNDTLVPLFNITGSKHSVTVAQLEQIYIKYGAYYMQYVQTKKND